jgi:transcriptional regulator NrdR family protein
MSGVHRFSRNYLLAYPCPRCNGRDAPVVKAERDDAYLARRRHCRTCGHDFDTYEIPADTLATIMARASERKTA